MPRFHFNVYDGHSSPDPEGTELPDWQAARSEAVTLAGALIRDEGRSLRMGEDWRMEVTDATNLTLFSLNFSIVEAAAVAQPRP